MRRSTLILAVSALAATVAALLLLSSPDRGSTPDDDRSSLPITFRDDEGVTVTVSSAPKRIVVIAPHLTEFVFAVGAGAKVVGVTGVESTPPEATVIASVVGPDGVTPDVGKIKDLAPDLVLASGFEGAQWKQELRTAGTTLITLHPTDIRDAMADMGRVGDLLSAKNTSTLLRSINEDVEAITKQVPSRGRPRVFVESLYPPLTAVGPAGFTGDLVKRAGGALVGPDSAAATFSWTIDELSQADPDLYLAPRSSASDVEAIGSRPGFAQLSAVRRRRVHVLPDDVLFNPGPRLARGLETLARLFHPGFD